MGQTADTRQPVFARPIASLAALGHLFVAVSKTTGPVTPAVFERESFCFILGPVPIEISERSSGPMCARVIGNAQQRGMQCRVRPALSLAGLLNGHFVLLPVFDLFLLSAQYRTMIR